MNEKFEDPIIGNNVSVYHAVQILNEALSIDQKAIETLFAPMVLCNNALANSNSVEAFGLNSATFAITPLSILNAIFAYSVEGSYYRIFPVYDEHRNLTEFRVGISTLDKPDSQ